MHRCLYHIPFCPFSRKIAFGLREKKIEFEEHHEKFAFPSSKVLSISPVGHLPVLLDNGSAYSTQQAISEYLNECYPSINIIGYKAEERGEVRRLCAWLEELFFPDTYMSIFYEKVLKNKVEKGSSIQIEEVREGRKILKVYLAYLEHLVEKRNFLGGAFFSWADVSAASLLSCLDYLGEVPWKSFPLSLEWYTKIKSRPAFRPFLTQEVSGIPPVAHYQLLDF